MELLRGSEGEDFRWFGNFAETASGDGKVNHAGIKPVQLRLAKGADGISRPADDSPVRGAAVPTDADALFAAGAAAQFNSDIDGQPRRVPTDAGFVFAYGPGSFRRHAAEGRRLGLGVRVVREPRLGWDVDVPDDLAHPALEEVLPSLRTSRVSPAS